MEEGNGTTMFTPPDFSWHKWQASDAMQFSLLEYFRVLTLTLTNKCTLH